MNQPKLSVCDRKKIVQCLPGLGVALIVAAISFITWWFLRDTWLKFSALLWAFIFSIIVTNLSPSLSRTRFLPGIDFSSTSLLRWSIALLGLTFSAAVWARLGFQGILVVLINIALAFGFGFIFCRYVLKMNDTLSILLSIGTSICGASAIAATAPAIRAKSEEIGLSLAVVTLFGLIAMFLYPYLFSGPLYNWLDQNPLAFGMWSGTGIHETAQVIAAASQIDGASGIAISSKFIRIFMIGPMVFISLFTFRRVSIRAAGEKTPFNVPWFAIVFIIFTLVHLALENSAVQTQWASFNTAYLKPAVTFLLAWSFAGIGLKVKLSDIKSVGLKTFLGGLVVALFAGITSLLLVKCIWL